MEENIWRLERTGGDWRGLGGRRDWREGLKFRDVYIPKRCVKSDGGSQVEHHGNILYKQLCVFLAQPHVWIHYVTSHRDHFVKHGWLFTAKCVKQLCVRQCEEGKVEHQRTCL